MWVVDQVVGHERDALDEIEAAKDHRLICLDFGAVSGISEAIHIERAVSAVLTALFWREECAGSITNFLLLCEAIGKTEAAYEDEKQKAESGVVD